MQQDGGVDGDARILNITKVRITIPANF